MKIKNHLIKFIGIILMIANAQVMADAICGRSMCGCWGDVNLSYNLTLRDKNRQPVKNIQAFCDNEHSPMGKSNATGVVQFSVATKSSPGCGFERCGSIKLVDPAKKFADKLIVRPKLDHALIKKDVVLDGAGLPVGTIYSDPKYTHPSFRPDDLPFVLPDLPFGRVESVPFYAIILKSLPKCSLQDSERTKAQAYFPKNKVFYGKTGCTGDYLDDLISYTNVNSDDYDFLAVYAGANLTQAKQLAEKVKRLDQFAGYNIRKMQVVYASP